jgi:hypothetical protein
MIKISLTITEENYFLGSIILKSVEKQADGSGLYVSCNWQGLVSIKANK